MAVKSEGAFLQDFLTKLAKNGMFMAWYLTSAAAAIDSWYQEELAAIPDDADAATSQANLTSAKTAIVTSNLPAINAALGSDPEGGSIWVTMASSWVTGGGARGVVGGGGNS